ncbi:hypothetical protein HKCCE2091_04860 [Rhodobacterales bacterium HKCCE2091]|nr:hypothetical protein [Rhodobacterales bacterium HKCCE2091]
MPNIITGGAGNDPLNGTNGQDLILGFGGNDTLNGFGGDDYLGGGQGQDLLNGGAGNDFIDGGTGNDFLYGDAGNDTLRGGEGADFHSGAGGEDTADYSDSPVGVFVSFQTGQGWFGYAQGDTYWAMEHIVGSAHDDLLQGDEGNNDIEGGDGNDHLWGMEGKDLLIGGAGNDTLEGGNGDDWLTPGFGDGTVSGGAGTDTLDLRVPSDFVGWKVDLAAGTGSRKKPFLFKLSDGDADAEKMQLVADDDAKAAAGGGGTDVLWPRTNPPEELDRAKATDWHEIIAIAEELGREAGHMTVLEDYGIAKDDPEPEVSDAYWRIVKEAATVFGEGPVMQAFGGDPIEIPPFENELPELETPELGGGPYVPQPMDTTWDLKIMGIENVVGSYGDDVIHANGLDNALYSGGGDDLIFAYAGDDFLYAEGGNATLDGGSGDDILVADSSTGHTTMTGGTGADIFQFITLTGSSLGQRGTVTDFEAGDRVDVVDNAISGAEVFIGDAAFTGAGGEVRVQQTAGQAQAWIEVDLDGDMAADWTLEVVKQDAGYMLSDADILVY